MSRTQPSDAAPSSIRSEVPPPRGAGALAREQKALLSGTAATQALAMRNKGCECRPHPSRNSSDGHTRHIHPALARLCARDKPFAPRSGRSISCGAASCRGAWIDLAQPANAAYALRQGVRSRRRLSHELRIRMGARQESQTPPCPRREGGQIRPEGAGARGDYVDCRACAPGRPISQGACVEGPRGWRRP